MKRVVWQRRWINFYSFRKAMEALRGISQRKQAIILDNCANLIITDFRVWQRFAKVIKRPSEVSKIWFTVRIFHNLLHSRGSFFSQFLQFQLLLYRPIRIEMPLRMPKYGKWTHLEKGLTNAEHVIPSFFVPTFWLHLVGSFLWTFESVVNKTFTWLEPITTNMPHEMDMCSFYDLSGSGKHCTHKAPACPRKFP